MSDGADCSLFLFVLWGVIGLVVCVVGATLNILAFLTFQLDRRSATTCILQVSFKQYRDITIIIKLNNCFRYCYMLINTVDA